MNTKPGFLLLNKPSQITSFACVNHIKKLIEEKIKIGHAGTLDPFATGLLIIAIGRQATRINSHLSTLSKKYITKAKLGELRDTLDYTGSVIKTMPATNLTEKNIDQALHSFGTSYKQVPPIYSALKYQGMPLHRLARHKKLPIEQLQEIASLKTKIVQLHSLMLVNFSSPYFTIKAHVSSGTYIRSLMHAIADNIGNCATTYALERTSIGPFNLTQAIRLEDIQQRDDLLPHIIPIESFMEKVTV